MKIGDLKRDILNQNPGLELEIKKDLAFQVAKDFEEARLVKGYTQDQLAKKIGTRQSNIARVENGRSLPSLSFLKRVAEAFNTYLIPPKFAFMEKITGTYTASASSSREDFVSASIISPIYPTIKHLTDSSSTMTDRLNS